VVQGASRGIGLELVRQLLERTDLRARSGGRVVATCRSPASSDGLAALLAVHGPRLTVLQLDCTDDAACCAAAAAVEQRFGRCDLLLNAAGVLHVPGELAPETALASVTAAALLRTYAVNAVGPLLVLKAFAPLLRASAVASAARNGPPVVAASLSARVGSLSENRLGGWHSYRASKAGLNMLLKTASLELAQGAGPVVVLALHPGTVATDLSRPFNRNVPPKALFSVETAARCLLNVLGDVRLADAGRFLGWDGAPIDW